VEIRGDVAEFCYWSWEIMKGEARQAIAMFFRPSVRENNIFQSTQECGKLSQDGGFQRDIFLKWHARPGQSSAIA
jgi:hypothetical protein